MKSGRLSRRIRWPWRTSEQIRADVDSEIEFHIEARIESLMKQGIRRDQAREQAMNEFGDLADARAALLRADEDNQKSHRRREYIADLRQDLMFGARTLRKSPGFTTLAILTLALGIGANTTIFTLIENTLIRSLPYENPDRIVLLEDRSRTGQVSAVADANFRDWQARTRSFERMAYHTNYNFGSSETVLGADGALSAWTAGVTKEFFDVFGAHPLLGRVFGEEERRENGPKAAVVSHGFWQNHLGGDAAVIGRTLDLLGSRYTIIAVMPPNFTYPGETDIWVSAEAWGENPYRSAKNWAAVGLLRSGISIATAQAEMARLGEQMHREFGPTSGANGAVITPLKEALVGNLRKPLVLLLSAATLVLLVVCTNLATALLARGSAREREFAVRTSLGARRGRLVQQLLTENALIAIGGAVLGVVVGAFALRAFLIIAPQTLTTGRAIHYDWQTGVFALVLAVLTTLLFGMMPAMRGTDMDVFATLRESGRGNTGLRNERIGAMLVTIQVALAIVLLVSSGLMIRSLGRVLAADVGFQPEQVLTVSLSLPETKYQQDEQVASFFARALDEVRRVPGVRSAGMIHHVPFGGNSWSGAFEDETAGKDAGVASYRIASSDYFRTMGIRLLRGRDFNDRDRAGSPPVVIVNHALAQKQWPGQDPVGKRIRDLANEPDKYHGPWLTIVGEVADVKTSSVAKPTTPEVYVNVAQHPDRARKAVITIAAGTVTPQSLTNSIRGVLRSVDADIPVEFSTMSDRVLQSESNRRFTMVVLAVFGALALLLSGLGIYGVVSYAVARRTREVGIRLALGATPGAVLALMQRDTMVTVVSGTFAGLIGAVIAGRFLRALLYGVQPLDPITIVASIVILGAVAWVASFVPARRSTRVDPMLVMRAE